MRFTRGTIPGMRHPEKAEWAAGQDSGCETSGEGRMSAGQDSGCETSGEGGMAAGQDSGCEIFGWNDGGGEFWM